MVIHTAITTYILSWLLIILFIPGAAESAEDWANNEKLKKEIITGRLKRLKKLCLIIN
jgi:hypothetical protein